MAQLVGWYKSEAHQRHPIERAAKVHLDFLLMVIDAHHVYWWTLSCWNLDIHLALLQLKNRVAYYEALDQWMAYDKTEAFIQLISEAVIEGFKPYQIILGI